MLLPAALGAGPVVAAFVFFSGGYGGMCFAWLSLVAGLLMSPAAGVIAIVNCVRYRADPMVILLSLLEILMTAGAVCYELWRLGGQWD